MKKLITLSLLSSIASSAQAESQPSYDETVDFIVSKASEFYAEYDGSSWVRSEIDFPERCLMRKFEVSGRLDETDKSGGYEYIQLHDIDPSTIAENNIGVYGYTTGGSEDIRNTDISDNFLFNHGSFSVRVPDERDYPRVARTLKHLVKICDGKEELF